MTPSWDCWYRHFRHNCEFPPKHPWHDPSRLSGAERHLVTRSIQHFELGEFATGRGFLRRAAAHPTLAADPNFLPTLELFIAEEQRHSRLLGRFLDREGLPHLTGHWVDGIFRRFRKLAGLEVCVTVLVTAEVLAVPFYRALRDATRSTLLRSICTQVLRDESAHLNYQALTISRLRRRHIISRALHLLLFHATALVVWFEHRPVFLAANCTFRRFWTDSRRVFTHFERLIAKYQCTAESFSPRSA